MCRWLLWGDCCAWTKTRPTTGSRKAIERGFLVNQETGQGRPLKLSIGDPIPDETQILPDIDTLRDRCSVGAVPGGESKEKRKRVAGKAIRTIQTSL